MERIQPQERDEGFFGEFSNPTVAQLNALAQLVRAGVTDDKPIKITFFNGQWTPPSGVDLIKQQKNSAYDQDVWLLVKHEDSALDILLKQ